MKCEFVKSNEEKERKETNSKIFRLMQKSEKMEAIIAELDVGAQSNKYHHEGEEFHLVLRGKMQYTVGDEVYLMETGDTLWHPSNIFHRVKNIGKEKAVYLTVSTPPTFM